MPEGESPQLPRIDTNAQFEPPTEPIPVAQDHPVKNWRRRVGAASLVVGVAAAGMGFASLRSESTPDGEGTSIAGPVEPGPTEPSAEALPPKDDEILQLNPDAFGLKDKYYGSGSDLLIKSDVPAERLIQDDPSTEVIPLIKIKPGTGEISFLDVSPTGVAPEVMDWFQNGLKEYQPFIKAALDSGTLKQVIIGTQSGGASAASDESMFINNGNLLVDIPFTEGTYKKETLITTVGHEVGHALFANRPISDLSTELADRMTDERFRQACQDVRNIAVDQLEKQFTEQEALIKDLMRYDPSSKRIDQLFLSRVQSGNLNSLYPTKIGEKNAYTETPSCEFSRITALMGRLREKVGAIRKDTNRESSPEERQTLFDLNDKTNEFAREDSVYKNFTDETYTGERLAGHPEDDLDEAAASLFMLTTHLPNEFGRKISELPEDQAAAITELWETVMEEYAEVPGVQIALAPGMSQVKSHI